MIIDKMLKKSLGTAVVFLTMLVAANGQQITPKHPGQDSYELYLSFFYFHEDFAKWTAARISANPTRKVQILASSAKYVGILSSEFAILERITNDTVASLRAVGEEARGLVESSQKPGGTVDHGGLAVFDNRRKAIVQSAVGELKRSLSRQSWDSLSSYINNQHRQHVTLSPKATRVAH